MQRQLFLILRLCKHIIRFANGLMFVVILKLKTTYKLYTKLNSSSYDYLPFYCPGALNRIYFI
jgi:hypothetical protein